MNKENKIVYSGFWRRAAAGFLDFIFVVLITCPALVTVGYTKSSFLMVLSLIFAILALFLYHPLQESSNHQATFGMRIMRLKIYTDSMQKISFWRSFGRAFASGAAWHYIIAPLSICSIVLWDKKQGLHDLVCRTVIVFTPNED